MGIALGDFNRREAAARSGAAVSTGDILGYQSQVASYQPDGLTVIVLMNTSLDD